MKMKNIFVILMMAVMMMIPLVSANDVDGITAVTFTTPAASDSIKGIYTFTGTYTGNSSGNITVLYNTSYGVAAEICADTTVSATNTTWTCSGDTSAFSDDCSGHTIRALAFNVSTGQANTNTANGSQTGVIFDNTNPTISSYSLDYSDIDVQGSTKYTLTSTDNCDTSLTYSSVMTKPDASTVTKTTSSDTYRLTDTDMIGTYTFSGTTTDNAGNTATNTNPSLTVRGKNNNGAITAAAVVQQQKGQNNRFIGYMLGAFGVMLGGLFVIYTLLYKKK
jgi:hypothetical protein